MRDLRALLAYATTLRVLLEDAEEEIGQLTMRLGWRLGSTREQMAGWTDVRAERDATDAARHGERRH